MHVTVLYVLAAALHSASVHAHRHHGGGGGGGGGGGRFNHGGDNEPNTFITIASAGPAAVTPGAGFPAPSASPSPSTSSGASPEGASGSIDASLIPPFGITAGIKAQDGSANCVGDKGKGIPCQCPPNLSSFIVAVEASVARGELFPSGNSVQDQLDRLHTCVVTLQNFSGGPGSGVGCPAVSTTWNELGDQLRSQLRKRRRL